MSEVLLSDISKVEPLKPLADLDSINKKDYDDTMGDRSL